ncbi:hypothetical protein GCM10011391_40150 [Pullulanibacillus camelliae]|uniref:Uncharacterized protein n=1 Tax=Pullulanibacillus camelliae TaxID=1707096 RepID=A0A8J2YND0_9BACL|nr:hypothetical protein [Pullulanibacillus camelliae]GGE57237.1 hypothetical protein GCM10011391_40150 [Pullulanibacillus camelliae]
MTKWNNTIFFENGIKHELTVEEINIIKKSLADFKANDDSEKETLEQLKSLFIHHLD